MAETMALIFDGKSEIGARVLSKSFILIYLRNLFRSTLVEDKRQKTNVAL